MKIDIEQEHINNGIRFDAENCPVCLAIQHNFHIRNDSIPDVSVCPVVYDVFITLTYKGNRYFFTLKNKELSNFLNDFDMGKEVKPTFFEMDLNVLSI